MRYLLFAVLFSCTLPLAVNAQSADEKAVRQILHNQTEAWNRGNLEDFMKGYWNNDSLMFVGKSGVTYGYQNTLNNYKKGYSNADQMGQLKFTLLKVQRIAADAYFVVGKWELDRKAGNVSGHYNLLFRKIKGTWVIVVDHSS
jgi:ketosteroid isomerase-like protein